MLTFSVEMQIKFSIEDSFDFIESTDFEVVDPASPYTSFPIFFMLVCKRQLLTILRILLYFICRIRINSNRFVNGLNIGMHKSKK